MKRDLVETRSLQAAIEPMRQRERFNFKNPPRAWRMVFVGITYALPGAIAGALAAFLLGHFVLLMILGTVLGAAVGAMLERRT